MVIIQMTGNRLYLQPLLKTFKQSEELYILIKKNLQHLIPFVDWEMGINSPEDCYDRIAEQHINWEKGKSYTYGIFDKENDKLIGIIFACHYSYENKNIELGCWLDKDYVGKGFMMEALAIFEGIFFSRGIIKIIAKVDTENLESQKFIKAAGYELEGTLNKDQWNSLFNCLRNFYVFSKIKN